MRTLWAILLAGFLIVGTEKTGLGENTEENEAKSLKENKIVIKKIWMIDIEENSKTRREPTEKVRQNMRLQEGGIYCLRDLNITIEQDIESLFELGDFVLLDIQIQKNEETKDCDLINLEIKYKAKNPNAKGLYKEGVLAQVGEQKIYLNQLVRKLKEEEIAVKEQLLTSQIHNKTFNKKISDTRKNHLDEEIVRAFCLEIYRQSPFQYPDYFFDKKERKVIREKYNGNRRALIQDLEEKEITFAEWRKKNREEAILSSVSAFLKSQGKTLSKKQIESFYDSNINEYLTDWKSQFSLSLFSLNKPGLPEFSPPEVVSQKDSFGNPVLVEKCEDYTFTIGKIEITGNGTVYDCLIRALIQLRYDEKYNQEMLLKSLIDIANLNLFSSVKGYFEETDEIEIASKKLVVEVNEKDLRERSVHNAITILPGKKEIIPAQFFGYANATKLVLPSGLEKIGNSAFAGCKKLKKIEIPESVKEVEPFAFAFCQEIDKIIFQETIKSIKFQAFHGCKSLVSAPVPPAMTNPPNVYSECDSLKEYVVSPNHPILKDIDGVLFSKDGNKLIHYPAGRSEKAYEVPSGCSVIGKGAFEDALRRKKIREIFLPDCVSDIEKDAFWGQQEIIVYLPKKFAKTSNQELEVMGLNPRTIRIRPESTPN